MSKSGLKRSNCTNSEWPFKFSVSGDLWYRECCNQHTQNKQPMPLFLYQFFRLSTNHQTTIPPLAKKWASAGVSWNTMAAILDYCAVTKLVCPLLASFPHSLLHAISHSLLRFPLSPGKQGPHCCHGDERACSAGEGLEVDSCRGNLTSRCPLSLYCPRCREIAKIKVLAWRMLHAG